MLSGGDDPGVYASCCGAKLYQYHDASGLEVDAIIETTCGDWIPVEIKLGAVQIEKACEALNKLESVIKSAISEARKAKIDTKSIEKIAPRFENFL